jgi:hypothetical protein
MCLSAETIRIFRRTRSGRAGRDDGDLNGGDEVTAAASHLMAAHAIKSEELPPPETPAAAKEANAK